MVGLGVDIAGYEYNDCVSASTYGFHSLSALYATLNEKSTVIKCLGLFVVQPETSDI